MAKTGAELSGPAGTATELLFHRVRGPQQATVAAWWLQCPGQSVAWDRFMLAVVHLRPLDGEKAHIRVPGATHEVLLAALNPERKPRPTRPWTWQYLQPLNVVEQVQLPDDAAAAQLLGQAAQAVVDGVLWAEPPLSGQAEPWHTSMVKTSAHLRGEEHAP
jgi:hypothetical protein